MHIRGTVRADRPLLVVALEEEADALDDGLPVLVTGPGKVNAGTAVSAVLASARPASVINIGTAGGLHDGLRGVHEVRTVLQHDFDSTAIRAIVNRDYGGPIHLESDTARLVLATGDRFIADPVMRDALARDAHLVDMEGYAVAWAARIAGVPVRLVKLVSDDAGADAARSWVDTVGEHARTLARWVVDEMRARLTDPPDHRRTSG
jgi:adenosylhomocysteine nucleosidase